MSASLTNITFEWIDGVDGSTIPEKSKPPLVGLYGCPWSRRSSLLTCFQMSKELSSDNGTLGCWRAHMNFLQQYAHLYLQAQYDMRLTKSASVVKENIQTALVMEDDADWDVNLKNQLLDFARGSKFLQQSEQVATESPYGDDWDLLWLGHCGVYNGPSASQYYYVTREDPTVVPPELFTWWRRQPDRHHPALSANYSRLVFEAKGGLCSAGYAISQRGARLLLNQQTQSLTPSDVADRALARFCNDYRPEGAGARCIAPYPALVGAHGAAGPMGKDSDRQNVSDNWREVGVTSHIVFSTRMNFKGLLGVRGTEQGVIRSQWPEKTMLADYSGELVLPKGEGVWVAKEDYVDT